MIKDALKKIIPSSIIDYRRKRMAEKEFAMWENSGRPVPPPHIVKQKVILKYSRDYHIDILLETGTCYGAMVEALKKDFKKIISIEISDELFAFCKNRLKDYAHVELHKGDSGEILPDILKPIKSACIFWLDGHYSGDDTGKGELNTPIFKELNAIFETKLPHVILIDDARLFVGKEDYPTMEQLKEYVQKQNPEYRIEVKDDVIRISIPK